jgi:hypothetical protein
MLLFDHGQKPKRVPNWVASVVVEKTVSYIIFEWKTPFRAAASGYDRLMVKAPTEADLVRLRQFLDRVETDGHSMPGEIDVTRQEIVMLKDEIAFLEAFGSKAFLLQFEINYGEAQRCDRASGAHRY